jgi:hypothetical protein
MGHSKATIVTFHVLYASIPKKTFHSLTSFLAVGRAKKKSETCDLRVSISEKDLHDITEGESGVSREFTRNKITVLET